MATSTMAMDRDTRFETIRLDNVGGVAFVMQTDGRCQFRFVNGNTWYVLTLGDTYIGLTKSVDNGQTFSQVWVK